MRQIHRIVFAGIAVLLMQAVPAASVFAQGAPGADQGGGGQEGYVGGDQGAAGPSGGNRPSLEMPVLYVTGVEVLRTAMDPKIDIIHVTGLVSSLGWTNPPLVPIFYGKPADDVLDLQFIATSPQQSQKADGVVPINATVALDAGPTFNGIRIRAR